MTADHRGAEPNRIRADVEALTGITPPRNERHVQSLLAAVSYIERELDALGCSVRRQNYHCGSQEYTNVVARFPAASAASTTPAYSGISPDSREPQPPRIVIGAHYDVYGDMPGADDNASGVAGLLELARLLNAGLDSGDIARTKQLELVAYCLEELPYFGTACMGSAVHAANLAESGVVVEIMLCLEMIGYFSKTPGSQHYPDPQLAARYPDTGDFIVLVGRDQDCDVVRWWHCAMAEAGTIAVESACFPQHVKLAQLSDHINYWRHGFPAVMVNDTSFLRNPNYHTPGDTAETLSYPDIAGVVDALYHALKRYQQQ